MRSLKAPDPEYTYDPAIEIDRLVAYRDRVHEDPARNRHIPAVGQAGRVLIASWNVANLGQHRRRIEDLQVIASMINWFEIVAIQEVADNLGDIEQVLAFLPDYFDLVFSDRAGNNERAAYLYDTRHVSLGPKIGEVAIVDNDRKYIRLPGIDRAFDGFNRNPYIATFFVEDTRLLFANCHLLYGSTRGADARQASIERRQLEAYAIARWCDLRRDSQNAWTKNIFAIGDFNLPRATEGDVIFEALTRRGLRLPPHTTRIPTNVSNTADYDQIAVTPGLLSRIEQVGVFDFDGVIFSEIYSRDAPGYWRTCAKYYISDHRPLWIQFEL
ncbi:MAG: endonuclease/exonuclease/phosphatase family protein [Bacteroidota bacterium]